MSKSINSNYINTTLGALVSLEKKSIISGPFGSNVGKVFFQKEGIPLIRGNNLSTGQEKFKDIGFVFLTREKANELNCYAIKNDIIFTAVGTIGQVGIIEEKLSFKEYVISNKQLRVRFDTKKIKPLYAYYWFSSTWIQKLILQQNVGSTIPLINLSVLKGLPIRFPISIVIQEQIVNALETISSKIEINNCINTELEAMAKTLYDYWFVQFDFPDINGKPYKTSGGKMVWNEELKREIPEGWENGVLSDLGNIIGGSTPSKEIEEYFSNEGIAWITPKDLSMNGENKFITKGEIDVSEKGLKAASLKTMPKGTILLSSRAPIGYMAIAREFVTTNQGFKSFVPKTDYSTPFIFYAIKNSLPEIINNASGSTFKEISGGTLKTIKTCLPERKIIKNFTEIVSPIFERQNLLELENQQLSSLRNWLLPMLMNGQVTVGGSMGKKIKYEIEEEMRMVAEPTGRAI